MDNLFESITGGLFATAMPLTGLLEKRLNFVYGRNGSGKSTIAKGFQSLKDGGGEIIISTNGGLTDEQRNNIFVFCEDFVAKNVLIEGDGLGTIVMLGSQVDYEEQLKIIDAELERLKNERANLENKVKVYSDKRNEFSPDYVYDSIRNVLTAENGWAANDRDIRGNTRLTSVNEGLLLELQNISVGENINADALEALKEKFHNDMQIYQSAAEYSNHLPIVTNSLENFLSVERLKYSLNEKVLASTLTGKDEILDHIMHSKYSRYLGQARDVFSDSDLHVCPLCLQKIDDGYKKDLLDRLSEALNEKVNEKIQELKDISNVLRSWNYARIDVSTIAFIGNDLVSEYNKEGENMKTLCQLLAEVFESKATNIFGEAKDFEWDKMNDAIKCLMQTTADVNNRIAEFNKTVDEKATQETELIALNKKIAAIEVKDLLEKYNCRKNEKARIEQQQRENDNAINDKVSERNNIMAQSKNVSIALDFINSSLSYIFFNQNRIKLENNEKGYRIKVRDKEILPKDLSTGERNAIALCYFFAKSFEGCEDDKRYDRDILLVIDDPVSSFDFNNRVGISSFLRLQLGKFYIGNKGTRILVMSHDLQTVFDLQKIGKEINNKDYHVLELKDKTLVDKRKFDKGKNEYRMLLEEIYNYATGNGGEEATQTIGNQMRKMQESYSTFIYNCGFDELHRKDFVMEHIPEQKREFYGNLMNRLVLNGESHMEERMYSYGHIISLFAEEEIRKTAKYILLFTYYINKSHLLAYLDKDKVDTIIKWSTEEHID